jgi:hypothetical protein
MYGTSENDAYRKLRTGEGRCESVVLDVIKQPLCRRAGKTSV